MFPRAELSWLPPCTFNCAALRFENLFMTNLQQPKTNLAQQFTDCHDRLARDAGQLSPAMTSFLEATLNEIAVDRQAMNLSDVWSRFQITLPRFTKLPSRVQNHPRLAAIAFSVVSICWWAVFPALLILQTTRMLLKQRKLLSHTAESTGNEHVAFVCNSRHEMLIENTLDGTPFTRVCPPAVNSPPNRDWLNVLQLLSKRDILRAALLSAKAAYCCGRYFPQKSDRVQSYTALSFFATWTALSASLKNAQSVRMANHYDRWAVLIDRLSLNSERWLVQHGMLYGDRLIPTKLKHTARLVAFDDESVAMFRDNVIAESAGTIFETRPHQLPLTEIPSRDSEQISLLLIGNLLHAEDEDRIVKMVDSVDDRIRLFIKPHPRTDQGRYLSMSTASVSVWQDKDLFPRVDLVISPESTLGKEYESTGIPVLWYARMQHSELQAAVTDFVNKTASVRLASEATTTTRRAA